MLIRRLVKAVEEVEQDTPFWPDTKSLITMGNVTPFISNFAALDIFGGDRAVIAEAWAEDVKSPLSQKDNRQLARVAQFYSIETNNREAKRHYLDSLKNYLLGGAQEDPDADQGLLRKLTKSYKQKTFSELAYRLGYPKFANEQQNPLRLLAELPLPIYITTSYHDFLEVALSKTSRREKPVSEIYYWRDGLQHIPSIFDEEPDYEPTVDRPLVYHLYGFDAYPESLVLTEDDYLDFVVAVTKKESEVRYSEYSKGLQRPLPANILHALRKQLLMIGYNVYDWEFRALFKSLIQPKSDSRLGESVSMQFAPDTGKKQEKIKDYLVGYFEQASFKVFWGNPQECTQSLWEQWQA